MKTKIIFEVESSKHTTITVPQMVSDTINFALLTTPALVFVEMSSLANPKPVVMKRNEEN